MKCLTFVFCVALLPGVFCDCTSSNKLSTNADEYYWRNYNGEIPEDAIEGGVDAKGKGLYIGQTLKEQPYGALVVGHIDPVKKKLVYAYEGYAYDVTENIKILCSQYPENFHWITNSFEELRKYHKHELVVGGYDTYPLYIGRTQEDDGGVIVGKLTLDPRWESFAYIVGRQAIFIKSGFDALTYKPGKNQNKGQCGLKEVHIKIFN